MADVKFSELTSLAGAALASDDIFAVVDTSTTTSKKLSVDNLFASVPVNINQSDATDATSSAGAIRTAGGVSAAKKLYVGETCTLIGQVASHDMSMLLGNSATATTTTLTSTASSSAKTLTLPNATDTLVGRDTTDTLTNKTLTTPVIGTSFSIGSATVTEAQLEILDGALATTTELNTVADGSTSIGTTAFASGDGIVTNDGGTMRQTSLATLDTYLSASTQALTNKTLTAAKIVDAGFIADANGNEQIIFQTTASAVNELEVTNAATGGGVTVGTSGETNVDLLLVAKGSGVVKADGIEVAGITGAQTLVSKTLTSPILTTPTVTTSIQASTDSADVVLNQYDGYEVGRIFDGATTPTTGFAAVQTAKGGFGYKRRVMSFTLSNTTESVMTQADSGSIVQLIGGAYADLITLPLCVAADAGWWCDFIVTTVFGGSSSLKIRTSGHADGNDGIHLILQNNNAVTSTVWSAGNDILTIAASVPIGTRVRMTCVLGGAAEVWVAEAWQPSGTSIAVASS